VAPPLIDVGAVESRGSNPHAHLEGPGLGDGDVSQLEDFVTTRAGIDDGSHSEEQ